MKVEFKAIINDLNQKTGADCEKMGKLILYFRPTNETMINLTQIYKPMTEVKVTVEDE